LLSKTKFFTSCGTPPPPEFTIIFIKSLRSSVPTLRSYFVKFCRHSLQSRLLLWIQAVQINFLDKSVLIFVVRKQPPDGMCLWNTNIIDFIVCTLLILLSVVRILFVVYCLYYVSVFVLFRCWFCIVFVLL
jgi:hypothetical protein